MQDDSEILRAAGFTMEQCVFRMPHGEGVYKVYLPLDTRSGKWELTYTVPYKTLVSFPPTTERGVLNWVRKHKAGKV